jgi:hypothetical protein
MFAFVCLFCCCWLVLLWLMGCQGVWAARPPRAMDWWTGRARCGAFGERDNEDDGSKRKREGGEGRAQRALSLCVGVDVGEVKETQWMSELSCSVQRFLKEERERRKWLVVEFCSSASSSFSSFLPPPPSSSHFHTHTHTVRQTRTPIDHLTCRRHTTHKHASTRPKHFRKRALPSSSSTINDDGKGSDAWAAMSAAAGAGHAAAKEQQQQQQQAVGGGGGNGNGGNGNSGSVLPSGERFSAVQDVLDRNAVLIRQVAANHDERTGQSVAANVPLLRELSAGVQRAVELYRDVAEALLGGGGGGQGAGVGGGVGGGGGAGGGAGGGGGGAEGTGTGGGEEEAEGEAEAAAAAGAGGAAAAARNKQESSARE